MPWVKTRSRLDHDYTMTHWMTADQVDEAEAMTPDDNDYEDRFEAPWESVAIARYDNANDWWLLPPQTSLAAEDKHIGPYPDILSAKIAAQMMFGLAD